MFRSCFVFFVYINWVGGFETMCQGGVVNFKMYIGGVKKGEITYIVGLLCKSSCNNKLVILIIYL